MARIPIAPPGMRDQRPRYTLGWRVGNHIYVAGQDVMISAAGRARGLSAGQRIR
jgi:hypothetical protein